LVHQSKVKDLEDEVSRIYTDKIGYAPSFYHVNIGDGVKTIEL
ncbi:galactokinase, partial [Staphylococcus nepalensis]